MWRHEGGGVGAGFDLGEGDAAPQPTVWLHRMRTDDAQAKASKLPAIQFSLLTTIPTICKRRVCSSNAKGIMSYSHQWPRSAGHPPAAAGPPLTARLLHARMTGEQVVAEPR